MSHTQTATRAEVIDRLWSQLNRPETPRIEIIGADASLTLNCLTDLA